MKTILKTISVSFMMLLVLSCNEKDMEYTNIDFNSTNFVVFSEAAKSVNELVTAPVEINASFATSNASATSVPFTITSDNAVEGVDYMIVDNKTSFDFTSDKLVDTIEFMPIDNLIADGDKTITITLNSSGVSVGYPGPDGNNASIVVTIVDNDCAYTLDELAAASWTGSDDSGGEGPNASQITMSYDGTTFLMEGIAYGWLTNVAFWDEVVVTSNPVVADINVMTGEITIAQQYLCTTTWIGAIQPDYYIEVAGNYDSCSETMTLNWDLLQDPGPAVLRSYTETITK